MNKIAITFLFLMINHFSYSQFYEDFENGIPGSMTEEYIEVGISWNQPDCIIEGRDRTGGAPCPINGDFSASFWDNYTGASTALRTPVMDLSSGLYRLEFIHAQREYVAESSNLLFVEISTDAGITWTEIALFDYNIPFPIIESYDLAAYNPNSQTMIRFRGEIDYGYALLLDDISVTQIPDYDVKMMSVNIDPITYGAEIPITGIFKNNGLQVINSVVLNWQTETQNTVHSQEINNLNLAAGESYNFLHNSVWETAPGLDNIKVWISNVNGNNSDENQSNDFLKMKVNVASGVVSKQRVLYEEFTSSTCPPCFYFNENFFNTEFLDANTEKFSLIKYQMDWPGSGDPYYTEEGGIRKEYYSVIGVPNLKLEGSAGWFYSNDPNILQINLDEAILKPAYFTINATHNLSMNGWIDVEVNILPNIADTYKVHVVVVEKETFDNVANNGETSFNNVMMKMLPDAEGTLVTFNPDEPVNLNYSTNLSGTFVEEMDDLEVIVFIQSIDYYKTVMQSQISELGVLNIDDTSLSHVKIYPNPARGILNVTTDRPVSIGITDLLGKIVFHRTSVTDGTILDISMLQSGIYFAVIEDGNQSETKKLVVE